MILVGIGANLPSDHGSPLQTCEAALDALENDGVGVVRRSRWYESAPVPASDQPGFVNAVAVVRTKLAPPELLALLHRIEARFGRAGPGARAARPNAARPLDLDLLAYHGAVRSGPEPPILPHPRMGVRAFVLRPLKEVAPRWRHPVSGKTVSALIRALGNDQIARPLG